MPFITQGKTNWKFLLIVATLAILAGTGILWWINQQDFSIEFPEVRKPEKEKITEEEMILIFLKISEYYEELDEIEDINERAKIFFQFSPIHYVELDGKPNKEIIVEAAESIFFKALEIPGSWSYFEEEVSKEHLIFHDDINWIRFSEELFPQNKYYPRWDWDSNKKELTVVFKPIPDEFKENELKIKESFEPISEYHYEKEKDELYISLHIDKAIKFIKICGLKVSSMWEEDGSLMVPGFRISDKAAIWSYGPISWPPAGNEVGERTLEFYWFDDWLEIPKKPFPQENGYPIWKISDKDLTIWFKPIPEVLRDEAKIKENFKPLLKYYSMVEADKLKVTLRIEPGTEFIEIFGLKFSPKWEWVGGRGALDAGYFYFFHWNGREWEEIPFDRLPLSGVSFEVGDIKPDSWADISIFFPFYRCYPPTKGRFEWNREKNLYEYKETVELELPEWCKESE